MMIHRPAAERGHFNFGWLNTAHSFSFGDYYDPRHMGFRALRVINEDHLAPGGGFPFHGHADMEIVTYIVDGALEHKDSLGTGEVIRPGDAQRMSAGTGIRHSEFNASKTDPVHLLQIWLLPSERGIAPGYEQKTLPVAAPGETRLDAIATPKGGDTAVTIRSDAIIQRALVAAGDSLDVPVTRGHAWLQVVRGTLTANGQKLVAGDGLAVSNEASLSLAATEAAELLVFDLG